MMTVISNRQDVEANDRLKAACEKTMLECIQTIEPDRQELSERNKSLVYGLVFEYEWNSDEICFPSPTKPPDAVEDNSYRVGILKVSKDEQVGQKYTSEGLQHVPVYMRPVIEDTIHWIGLELVTADSAIVKAEQVEYKPEDLDANYLAAIFAKWDKNEYCTTLKYNNELMVFKLRWLILIAANPDHHDILEGAYRKRLVGRSYRSLLLCAQVLPKMIGFLEETKACYRPTEDWSWQALC